MSGLNEKFFNEIKEMIAKQQYNEETVDKLVNIIAVSQILAERENNNQVKEILINVSIVGTILAKKLYALKEK